MTGTATIKPLDRLAAARATIHGRVLDETEKPVEHATVLVNAARVKIAYSTLSDVLRRLRQADGYDASGFKVRKGRRSRSVGAVILNGWRGA